MLPKFSTWSAEFREKELPLSFAQIDADLEPEIKPVFNIDGYPTLVLFKDGSAQNFKEYIYANEKEYLMPWLREQGIQTV